MPIEHQLTHLNNNAMCSVAIETTGMNPRQHDIVEICVILVDNFYRPSQKIVPFYTMIQPLRPENIDHADVDISRERLTDAVIKGLEPSIAADRFEEWVDGLDMPEGKKIVPICHDWGRVAAFLETWLGHINFHHLVSMQARDLQTTALYINDCSNLRVIQIPYPKVNLGYLGLRHKIEVHKKTDVMEKCVKQAEIYRLMLGH